MPLESRSLCVYINSSTMHRTVFSLILTSDTLKPCTRDALLIPVWWIIVWAWTSLQQQLVTRRRPGGRALHSWGLQVCMVCGSPVFVVRVLRAVTCTLGLRTWNSCTFNLSDRFRKKKRTNGILLRHQLSIATTCFASEKCLFSLNVQNRISLCLHLGIASPGQARSDNAEHNFAVSFISGTWPAIACGTALCIDGAVQQNEEKGADSTLTRQHARDSTACRFQQQINWQYLLAHIVCCNRPVVWIRSHCNSVPGVPGCPAQALAQLVFAAQTHAMYILCLS